MNCTLIQWSISESLNERRPVPPDAEAHAARCPACRAFLEAARASAERLGRADPAATGSVVARVAAAIERGDAAPARAHAPVLAWAGALACAALAVSLTVFRPVPPRPAAIAAQGGLPRVALPGAEGPVLPVLLADYTGQAVDRLYRDEQARLLHDVSAARDFLLACVDAAPGLE
jgi:hypothetical protein